jgi:cold shock protein
MKDETLYYGTVIFFSAQKGYGFLQWEKDGIKQKDMFVHFSDVNCTGFKTLFKDQKVSFNIGTNHHGDPKATNVLVLTN